MPKGRETGSGDDIGRSCFRSALILFSALQDKHSPTNIHD